MVTSIFVVHWFEWNVYYTILQILFKSSVWGKPHPKARLGQGILHLITSAEHQGLNLDFPELQKTTQGGTGGAEYTVFYFYIALLSANLYDQFLSHCVFCMCLYYCGNVLVLYKLCKTAQEVDCKF